MDSKTRDLRKILIHVNKNSRFYRKRFKQYGIDPKKIKSIQDFQEIPFTTREDLAKNNPYDFLCVPESEVDFVRFSSGTSGRGIVINFRVLSSEISEYPIFNTKSVKTILLLGVPDLAPPYCHKAKKSGKTIIVGDIYNLYGTALKVSKLRIDAVESSPAVFFNFTKHLEKMHDLNKIKLLELVGENLSKERKSILKRKYPKARIYVTYGLTEVGILGFRCRELIEREENIYHTKSGFFYEIINPDTNKPCKFGERGDLVVTNLKNIAMPLIRYRTGDMVKISKHKCACGEGGILIELIGRAKFDFIRLGEGVELYSEDIEKVVMSFKKYLKPDFQVHVYDKTVNREIKPNVVINVVLKDTMKKMDKRKMKKIIRKRLPEKLMLPTIYFMKSIAPKISLKRASDMKILTFSMKFVEEISKDPEELKTKMLIDHRK